MRELRKETETEKLSEYGPFIELYIIRNERTPKGDGNSLLHVLHNSV